MGPGRDAAAGFTLIEALVALAIVAMVVISFIGIRTNALVDATEARNWRLAREIAEEKLSELLAGARETPPESGETVPLERYQGFAFKIVIGEAAVAELEAEVAQNAAAGGSAAGERIEWQRDRENFRRAQAQGLSASEYQDKLAQDDYRRRMAEKAPSATEFEEVAVVVYFPKMNADYEGQKDTLVIKARVSTLALSGMTPAQARTLAASKGESAPADGAGAAPALGGSR
ncbi:MAG: prepilin-type N-terminal cleavage/methylation domain-containing protein [Planctomycetes bacterium]|nr:prepilin-type N-terminal cleavage/methylation domain-containing protein [Planctomycetota bacterium]